MQNRNNYTPDVLDCLANLSNDEVFTPPAVVNQMLDMLPQEVFMSKDTTFLDPFTKSGVFLREITKRLLENQIPDYKKISDEIEIITKEAIQNAVRSGSLDLDDKDYEDKARSIGDAALKSHPDANKYLNFEIDLQDALDHILKNQVFGIAITELTAQLSRRSLYCSKDASSRYSVANVVFGANADGNIRFEPMKHTWDKVNQNGTAQSGASCTYCGASASNLDRPDDLESHAYEFIHKDIADIRKEFGNMEFTVVCGNPPYQLETNGSGKQAIPIYNKFVEQAKRLNPKYLLMIIPARWYSGGFGLNSFRKMMLSDKHISVLVDYPNYKEVFPSLDGLAGGACYFLRDSSHNGDCSVTNIIDGEKYTSVRALDEYDTFIRYTQALPIIEKVFSVEDKNKTMEHTVSPQRPFGISTNYAPTKTGIPCYFTQKQGLLFANPKDVDDANGLLNKWKLLVPKSPIAGQTDFTKPIALYYESNTRIARPGECCSESWIVAGAFDTEDEVLSFKSYLFTKTVRFLLLQAVVSQDVLRNKYCFVPSLDKYVGTYDDDMLRQRWHLSDEDWSHIESRVKNID